MNKDKQWIYYRENLWQSLLGDIGTWGCLVGSFYINYRFIGNNHFLAGLLVVMVFVFLISKAGTRKITYTDKAKLIKDLQDGKL